MTKNPAATNIGNLTALIADDKFLGHNYLSKLILHSFPDIKLVGQASAIDEAFLAVRELQPDLLFLDSMLRFFGYINRKDDVNKKC